MNNKLISLKQNSFSDFLGGRKVKSVRHDAFTRFLNKMHSAESCELIRVMSERGIPVSIQIVALCSDHRTKYDEKSLYRSDPKIVTAEDRLAYAEWLMDELPMDRFDNKAMDLAQSFVFNRNYNSDGKYIYREHVLLRNYYKAKFGINDFEYGQVGLFQNDYSHVTQEAVNAIKFANSLERVQEVEAVYYAPGRIVNLGGKRYQYSGLEIAYKIKTDHGLVWGNHQMFKALRMKANAKIVGQMEMCILKGKSGEIMVPWEIVQKYNKPDKVDIQYTNKLSKENARESKSLKFAMKMARLRYGSKVKPVVGKDGQQYLMIMPKLGLPSDPLQPDEANRRDCNIYKETFKRLRREEGVKILTDEVLAEHGIEVPLVSISITGSLELRDHHRIWGANDSGLPIYVRVGINHPSLN